MQDSILNRRGSLYGPDPEGLYLETPRFPLKGSLKGDIDVGIDRVQVPDY